MPRNRELMRIFRDLEYVEHLGSGMNRILRAYDRNIFHLTDNFLEIVFPFEEEYLRSIATVTDQVTDQVTEQVTEQVRRLIQVMEGELSGLDIMKILKLNHKPNFRLDYLQPAIKEHLIEMSIPDKPNSKMQKYRLSKKGIKQNPF
jgi:ATP-dependent DNA helicase RecG